MDNNLRTYDWMYRKYSYAIFTETKVFSVRNANIIRKYNIADFRFYYNN